MKNFKIIKVFILIILTLIIIAKYSPSLLIWALSDRIDKLGSYLYNNEEVVDELDFDPYMLNPDYDVPEGFKSLLILGCDELEGNYGSSGGDIAILLTSQKSGEIHMYSISRDLQLRIPNSPSTSLILADVCRNYETANFIKILEMNIHVPINNYILFHSKDKVVEKVAETFMPEGISFELNEIELIGINQILINTVSDEEKAKELFRDNEGILGEAELGKLSTASEFIGFYLLPDGTKVFPDANGAPLLDENINKEDLVMYVEYFPTIGSKEENEIEFNGKHYIPCSNQEHFLKYAYSEHLYLINKICNTNFSDVKKSITLSPKQLQAFARLRHSYLDQGVSRNTNISEIIKKLISHYVRNPSKLLKVINSDKTEDFFQEAGESKMIQVSFKNISNLLKEMYPKIAPIEYGSYANVDGQLLHIKFLPDPYHPLSEASMKTQMHWALYGY